MRVPLLRGFSAELFRTIYIHLETDGREGEGKCAKKDLGRLIMDEKTVFIGQNVGDLEGRCVCSND